MLSPGVWSARPSGPGLRISAAEPAHLALPIVFSDKLSRYATGGPTSQASTSATERLSEPSVHPQETTKHQFPSTAYQDILRNTCFEEWVATKQTYEDLDRIDHKLRAWNLTTCRDNAWFAVNLVDRRVRILSDSCKLRWCPLCSRARSSFLSAAVTAWLKSHARPKLLTLTLAHSPDSLDSQISRLYACFRQLRRLSLWKRLVHGGIWFFQIKMIKKTLEWHPHIHILLDSEYIPHGLLKAAWLSVTGDSTIVDIRTIYNPQTASNYVARYSARPCRLSDLDASYRLEIVQALHGRRLCGKFGTAQTCDLSGRSPDDPADLYSVLAWDSVKANCEKHPGVKILWAYYCSQEPLPLEFDVTALADEFNQGTDGPPAPFHPPESDPFLFATNPVVFSPKIQDGHVVLPSRV